MWNRVQYFFELILLFPFLPCFYFQGKKLRERIIKLPSHAEFLVRKSKGSIQNLLIIGESTAAGVGASSPNATFSHYIYNQLKQEYDIYNLGKKGLKVENLKKLLVHGQPDIPMEIQTAVILIGANDCFKFTPPGKFKKHIKEFVLLLILMKGTEKIIISPIPFVHQFPSLPKSIRFFLGWHRTILTKELENLAKKLPEMKFENIKIKYPIEYFAEDGIHPSDMGYEKLAFEISKKVAK
jgi:lysophospholipase L1-like esterase